VFSDASHEQVRQARPPVGAHDNQARSGRSREVDDRGRRRADHGVGCHMDMRALGDLHHLGETLARLEEHSFANTFSVWRKPVRDERRRRIRFVNDVQEPQG
jgi:hypothetical protein